MKFISFHDRFKTLVFINIDHIISGNVSKDNIYIITSPGYEPDSVYHYKREEEPKLFEALKNFFESQLADDYRIN